MLFLLLICLLLSIPAVQTQLGKLATNRLNKDFGTNLVVNKIDLSFLGSVQLKGIEIRDHHKDTLIFLDKLSTSLLNAKKILDNKVNLGSVSASGLTMHLKTYKGEDNDNLSIFVESFDDDTPKDSLSSPFILRTSNIYIDGLNFKLLDFNEKDPLQFEALNGGGNLQDFSVVGPEVNAKIRGLYFTENRGISITNLSTDFLYSKTQMKFDKTTLQTNNSKVFGDIEFKYKREDLQYFKDKVTITAKFKKSSLSILDVQKLYNELQGNDLLNFTGNINGTLNNFKAQNLNVTSSNGMKIIADLGFKNALSSQRGFEFTGDLENVTASYNQLKRVLPNLLGKTLPTEFSRLGKFTLSGRTLITPEKMDAVIDVDSEIGTIISDLELTNIDDIDLASYSGEVEFQDFNIGKFVNDPILGKVTLSGDVNGSGFKVENINTSIIGKIENLEFNGYNYQDLLVNGQFQLQKFDGDLKVNDENLKLDFNGLADFSSAINKFDFTADIGFANLKETKLFERDSISRFKGKAIFDLRGNTLDDMIGKINFSNVEYTNQKQKYPFKQFEVTSAIKDSIKTIKINSEDIVKGELEGKFLFSELLPVSQNALGSIYANYNPYKVLPNQFLNFNFTIYNQIIDVFFPQVSIAPNTKISGSIKGNTNGFKLRFNSPEIDAYGVKIDKLALRLDNKNPLFNTHLTADKVDHKYYKVEKLNLLNRTVNDTLFFKSEFTGGRRNREKFNLDFFYTIDETKKSVVGIEKSTFNFKENNWSINPGNNKENKVVFDIKTNEFDFKQFKLKAKEQEIAFSGMLRDSTEKALNVDFTKVKLASFLPPIDSLSLKGVLDGNLDFSQKEGIYSPEGLLRIKDFSINGFQQGDLALNVKGENSYEKYSVDLSLSNQRVKSIAATGSLDFSTKRPQIDLGVFLENFQLEAFSPLGQDVLSKLRGEASGSFTLKGALGNPSMDGLLFLEGAGLKFPYLDVDYDMEGVNTIRLKEQSFFLNDITLRDTEHNTKGNLKGSITHSNFKLWSLDLTIDTDNLLVLNTKETEESLYYGTGFLKGNARIYGLTDRLFIDVVGSTQPNTKFVIPISDVKTVDNYKLITFKKAQTDSIVQEQVNNFEALKGLTLDIKLDVTKDAEAEVVIDKNSGSALRGKGEGNLQIVINTRGKFTMDGNFVVDEGQYDFKYGGLVNRTFDVEKGGSISWNGDPFDASLNIQAKYTTRANPAVLLENFNSNRKIPVDLFVKITGGLFNSKQEFDIKIPNVNPAIKSELEFKLNDNDINEKTFQFLSLLAFNKFYNPDATSTLNSASAIIGTTSSAISGVLSDLISSKDGKVQFGLGYDVADENDVENLNTEDQINVSVGTQISDRVIVNGKVGVPVGSKTQASVVGEVKVEILLNEDGTFRTVIFNRQNEIQYSTEEEGYTQGVGLTYQVNFNNLSDLLRKIGIKRKKKKVTKKRDSIFLSPDKSPVIFKKN